MTKKVLVISQHFYPEIGSAGNRMKNVYKLLKENDYDVDVLTTEPTYPNKKIYSDEQFWDDDSLDEENDVTRVKVANRKYSRSIINRLWYYLEIAFRMILFILFDRKKYDVIFVTSPPIFIAIVGLVAKYRYQTKMILDIRDLWPESLKGVGVFNYRFIIYIFSRLEKLLYVKADKIIVNSQRFKDFIIGNYHIPLNKISFMPNAARQEEISPIESGDGPFKVMYAGNIGLAQDVTILMELAKELNEYDIQLTVMGYGFKKREFVKFAKEHKLSNVNFMKPSTRKECLKTISAHHIGIVTLNGKEVFETVLPGKIIDYMTCSLPIVGAVSGYAKMIIETTEAGIVAKSHDAEEMLKHILYLYQRPSLRSEMALNSRKYVQQHFLWERNINVLINLIENRVSTYEEMAPVETREKAEVL